MNVKWWFNIADSTVYSTLKALEKKEYITGTTEKVGNICRGRNNDFSRSVKYLRNINSIHINGTVPVIFEIYRGGALIYKRNI